MVWNYCAPGRTPWGLRSRLDDNFPVILFELLSGIFEIVTEVLNLLGLLLDTLTDTST